jgi:hydroxylamine reductase (hybrid-cluster protein)
MTEGMKSGATNPFDDESPAADSKKDDQTDEGSNDNEAQAELNDQPQITTSTESTAEDITSDDLPYVIIRDKVKENREMVSYFLRPETQKMEEKVERIVSEEIEADVMKTDIREALVHVGTKHVDEVIELLRKNGYRLKE